MSRSPMALGWKLRATALALYLDHLLPAAAYPYHLPDASCRAWQPGHAGYMASGPLVDGSIIASGQTDPSCALSVAGNPTAFQPGQTYDVTITAAAPSLYKLYSSDGQCIGYDLDASSMATTKTYSWTAPSDPSTVTLHCLCASGYSTNMYTHSYDTHGPMPARPTPTPTAEPTKEPGKVGTGTNVVLTELGSTARVTLDFRPIGNNKVEMVVKADRQAWLGFGVSAGSRVSMSGSGQGADVVVCSAGSVRRYWVTSTAMPAPSANDGLEDASCIQADGSTILTFTRRVGAVGSQQRALSPGNVQQVTYAYGDGVVDLQPHSGSDRGGIGIDFATGATVDSEKRAGEAVLFLHLMFMILAWGGCLPFGIAVARRARNVEPKGGWFAVHKKLMISGLCVQLLGFLMAVWYCQEHSLHFHGWHAIIGLVVVCLSVLQPLNAVFRPQATEPKSWSRVAFEVVHKGSGYIVAVLALFNVFSGVVVVIKKDYDDAVVAVAIALVAICVLPILCYFVLAAFYPDNRLSRWVLAVGSGASHAASKNTGEGDASRTDGA